MKHKKHGAKKLSKPMGCPLTLKSAPKTGEGIVSQPPHRQRIYATRNRLAHSSGHNS
jgi:hypothetical protein